MLVLAAAVELAAKHKLVPHCRNMVWLSDIEGAVDAFNRRGANSRPKLSDMRQALEVMDSHGVRVYTEFIEGKKNTIADNLSRGLPDRAVDIAAVHLKGEAEHVQALGNKVTKWAEYRLRDSK